MKIVFTQEELNSFIKHHLDLVGKTVEVEIYAPKTESQSWIPYNVGDVRDVLSTRKYVYNARVEVLLHNGEKLIGAVNTFPRDKIKAYRFV